MHVHSFSYSFSEASITGSPNLRNLGHLAGCSLALYARSEQQNYCGLPSWVGTWLFSIDPKQSLKTKRSEI
jgi:hypothetical protein